MRTASNRWHVNKTAINAYLRNPKGFEEWFYTGPTLMFGHAPPKKRRS